jgi:predicted dehydrogenase
MISVQFTPGNVGMKERQRKRGFDLLKTLAICFMLSPLTLLVAGPSEKLLRVGIIGLDTSHALKFTKIMRDPAWKTEMLGCRVVAAFPEGSQDIESSVSRVPKNTQSMREMGVEIVDSIEALLGKVDVVMLETNDGRPHLQQALPVLRSGKTLFIDKPVGGTLVDTIAIFELARHYQVPIFSSSALRYGKGVQEVRAGKRGKVIGCDTYSPSPLEPHHPDLFWYGIHGLESLFTVMGTGCQSVSRSTSSGTDVLVGIWEGGRIGTFRGIRDGKKGYGGTVFTTEGTSAVGSYDGYEPLVVEIVKFLRSGVSPVADSETLEIYTFMEAADESKRRGGAPVKLSEVMEKARSAAKTKVAQLLGR